MLLLGNKEQQWKCARKFRNVWVCRRRSGHEWTASSSLHHINTVKLALVQC